MKSILLLTVSILLLSSVYAQEIKFGYDQNGNRTSRYLILKSDKSSEADTTKTGELYKNDDLIGEITVKIFPNPVTDNLTVICENASDDENTVLTIQLIDLQGKVLVNNIVVEDLRQSIPMKELPAGIYFLRLSNGTIHKQWKIVKQ